MDQEKKKWTEWTAKELKKVLRFYCSSESPRVGNPNFQELVESVARHSQKSVDAQYKNFVFLDPKREGGLPNVSKAARRIWEMHHKRFGC